MSNHLIAVVVKYHGPTDNKGSRVSLTLPRWDDKRVTVSYNYECGDSLEVAEKWLTEHSVPIVAHLDMDSHYVLCVSFSDGPALRKAFGIPEA